MAAQYPDTTLRDEVLDPDFGGAPANVFGQLAWKWANSLLRFLGQAYLTYLRAPYTTVVAVSTDPAAAGHVAAFARDQASVGALPYVGPYNGARTNQVALGVYLEPASAGARARIATTGIVPASITGLGSAATSATVYLDTTTGRLTRTAGAFVLGRADPAGNVLFSGHGNTL